MKIRPHNSLCIDSEEDPGFLLLQHVVVGRELLSHMARMFFGNNVSIYTRKFCVTFCKDSMLCIYPYRGLKKGSKGHLDDILLDFKNEIMIELNE